MKKIERCFWCNLDNDKYVKYHDEEWGVPIYNDSKLFELLILESFQAGLSWECVLNKREFFRKGFSALLEYNFAVDSLQMVWRAY